MREVDEAEFGSIGRLRRVPLREVWKHEAFDFTRWLQDNLDVVSDEIGIELADAEREQPAGSFSVDLIAKDESDNLVIIENQLEKSDHDHLGKVITYLTSYEAKTAIWIVSDPRPEHITAIAWLNQSKLASFYLLKVEAVRIGDSMPAPMLTLIVGPSEEGHAVGETKQERVEQDQTIQRFWISLLERAREKTSLHANSNPGRGTWLSHRIGLTDSMLNYIVRVHDGRVELYISSGSADDNRRIFNEIYRHKEEIEASLHQQLEWDNRDDRQICKIVMQVDTMGGYRDTDHWPEIQETLIDAMIRFESALRPAISELLAQR